MTPEQKQRLRAALRDLTEQLVAVSSAMAQMRHTTILLDQAIYRMDKELKESDEDTE